MKQIIALDPADYQRHRIHGENRIWAETNCYVDVWIELLHGWGFEPIAALPFTLAIDFEGDQWTFFKFSLRDLYRLYGLDVQELAIWRPLVDHIEEQVALGRPVLVELDSCFLPDTAGTAYRRDHVKSTVAVNAIDVAGRRLGYFHNQGYYHLDGDDFVDVFRLREPRDSSQLPPYVEFVKRRQPSVSTVGGLARISLGLLREQLAMLPVVNPFVKFKSRFTIDLEWLATETLDMFHRYSFATLRQFGACYELSATFLTWLQQGLQLDLHEPIAIFTELATDAKTLQFELARAVMRKKPLDLSAIDRMATQWQAAMDGIKASAL
ncbi:MAG: DUF1839 family protein [Planctomycetia bacterium]|nr:DUF1839 family protein [Planctomycetia bacterium]